MSNDEQWLEDVHRWYYGGTPPDAYREDHFVGDEAIGYEAAHPALQSQQWPDAPWAARMSPVFTR